MCFSQPRDTKTVLCDTTDFGIDLITSKNRGSIVDVSTNTDTLNQKRKKEKRQLVQESTVS